MPKASLLMTGLPFNTQQIQDYGIRRKVLSMGLVQTVCNVVGFFLVCMVGYVVVLNLRSEYDNWKSDRE